MRSLLDINVLLALLDTDHVDHERAYAWLDDQASPGWASCPLTENGFVRIISQPGYPNPVTSSAAISTLRDSADSGDHQFWPDSLSVLDPGVVLADRLLGPRQLTDAYLLALSVANDGRFITFDRRITVDAVVGADPEHLVVV